MGKKTKRVPNFKNEEEEFEFWSTHDVTDYVDIKKSKRVVFQNLKPTARLISIRLPEYLLGQIKNQAHKKDIPYQSLMKVYLADRIKKEIASPV